MDATKNAVDFLKTLRGPQPETPGLKIIIVQTTDPNPITFTFDGTPDKAIDIELFEIPVDYYPLRKGDRLLVFPLVGEGASQRWGAIAKINGGVTLATMSGPSSLKVPGVDKEYGAVDLIIPPVFQVKEAYNRTGDWAPGDISNAPEVPEQGVYAMYTEEAKNWIIRPLKAGDLVSIGPTLEGEKIKYVILELIKGV